MATSISAVIPAFNSASFVAAALDSVLAQSMPVDEIIVVDDGSTDATTEIVALYPQVTLLRINHGGPSAARNAGIRYARGDYIAFLDSDDLWLPDKIEKQLAAFARCPEAGFCFSTFWFFSCSSSSNGAAVPADPYWPEELRSWLSSRTATDGAAFGDAYRMLLSANCVSTSSVLANKQALIAAGLFDESLTHGEDHDLWLRLARGGPAIFVSPNSRVRIHPRELSGAWDSRQDLFYRSTIEILRRHRRKFPSRSASRALASAYNNFATYRLKAGRRAEARRFAGKGLQVAPSFDGLRLWCEAMLPGAYSYVASRVRGARTS